MGIPSHCHSRSIGCCKSKLFHSFYESTLYITALSYAVTSKSKHGIFSSAQNYKAPRLETLLRGKKTREQSRYKCRGAIRWSSQRVPLTCASLGAVGASRSNRALIPGPNSKSLVSDFEIAVAKVHKTSPGDSLWLVVKRSPRSHRCRDASYKKS
jgi:hypothetical protein